MKAGFSDSPPVVSIIICTRNRCQDLLQTLEALRAIEFPAGLTAELIIVDNGSTDDTRQVASSVQLPQLPISYCFEPKAGQANARNTGLAAGNGEVFLFTDDDVRPPSNWVERMCGDILSRKTDAMAGGVKIAPQLLRPWMMVMHRGWLAGSERLDPRNPQDFIGANMAFSRAVLERVPSFDPELGPGALGYADDTLFAWQLKSAGFRLAGGLDCEVEHHFEPARLRRLDWRAAATKHGRTRAYLLYHWEHGAITFPLMRYYLAFAKLARRRVISYKDLQLQEGCAHWETSLLEELALYHQFIIERRRPRNYEHRGLTKLRGVLARTGTKGAFAGNDPDQMRQSFQSTQ